MIPAWDLILNYNKSLILLLLIIIIKILKNNQVDRQNWNEVGGLIDKVGKEDKQRVDRFHI